MSTNTYKLELADVKLSVMLNNASFALGRNTDRLCAVETNKLIHNHPTHEIIIVTDGEITVNGENDSLSFKDRIIIISPKLMHYCVFNNASAIVFNFTLTQAQGKSPKVFGAFNRAIDSDITSFPISEKALSYAKDLYSCVESELLGEAIPPLISLLFLDLFKSFAATTLPKSGVRGTYITDIDVYITENLDKHISLDDLAKRLHICSKQVSRIIKKEYGCTLSELINRRRIGAAAMLLCNTELKIREIAAAIGYSTETRFITNFKKLHSISPSEYRTLHKQSKAQ